jgi:outer membrane lipoprotein carrier protein
VVINDADADASTVTPQTFLTASAQRYHVTATRTAERSGAAHDVLSLSATAESAQFRKAILWVRRTDRIVTRLRATDRSGSTLDLRLYEIDLVSDFADAPFTFSPPDGVEVVDLRADASG